MINLLFVIIFFLAVTNAFSQSEVKIGNQVWMTKNLDVDRFRNGVAIPQAKTVDELINLSEKKLPAWCYYEFDDNNGNKYGKLYNGYAVSDPRGIAPSGWHIPKDSEWDLLHNYIYQRVNFWVDIALKSKTAWIINGNINEYNKGNNKTGFSALPGGYCSVGLTYAYFYDIGKMAKFWTSSEVLLYNGAIPEKYIRELFGNMHGVNRSQGTNDNYFSIRCVKD